MTAIQILGLGFLAGMTLVILCFAVTIDKEDDDTSD